MNSPQPDPTNDVPAVLAEIDRLIVQRQLDAAEARCRQIAQQSPAVAEVWLRLGFVLLEKDASAAAADALRRASELQPANAAIWVQLSAGLNRQGLGAEAEEAARRAITLDETKAGHWSALGNALSRQCRWLEAAAAFRQSLAIDPSDASVWNNLAEAELKQSHFEAAREALLRAMTLAPGNVGPIANYAFLLCQVGQRETAGQWLPGALGLSPQAPQTYKVLGEIWQAMAEWKLAEAAYRTLLQLQPRDSDAEYSLARVLRWQRRFTEAEGILQKLLSRQPQQADAWALLGEVVSSQGRSNDATPLLRRAVETSASDNQHAQFLIALQYEESADPGALLTEHRRWDALHARPLLSSHPSLARPRQGTQPLRIGFLSSDFGRHPTGFMVLPAFEHFDRSACAVVCYSDRTQEDEFTARFRALASAWRLISGQPDEQIAEQIRRDKIDILVDLMGHTGRRLRVFARQPAPLQVTWFGYVGTTGLTAMNCLLADRFHVRDGEECFYSERVLRMPNGYACYGPPADAPAVGPLPATANGYVTFGCFNNLSKYSPGIAEAWATMLTRVPGSKLLLKSGGFDDAGVRRYWHDWFAARGIPPERILLEGWSPPGELLACYNRVDLALDTQPYSGGLTTCEALWMGVPVVTLPGKTFAGRHSTSHMTNAGYGQFVAEDLAGYIDVAIAWSQRLEELAATRTEMRQRVRQSPLCDAPRFASDFLQVLTNAWNSATERQNA